MNEERIKGAADKIKGEIKEKAGEVLHDSKLTAEGKADKAKGQVENVVGGVKDAVDEAQRK